MTCQNRKGVHLITTADLKTQTRRDLADTARQIGVTGWHSMKKEELIEAIRKAQRQTQKKPSVVKKGNGVSKPSAGSKSASAKGGTAKSAALKEVVVKEAAVKEAGSKSTESRKTDVKSTAAKAPSSKSLVASDAEVKRGPSKGVSSKANSKANSAKSLAEPEEALSPAPPARKRAVATKQPTKAVESASVEKLDAGKSRAKSSLSANVAKAKKLPEREPTEPRIVKVLRKQQAAAESRKDLSACVLVHHHGTGKGDSADPRAVKDRIVLIVRDSYWLQASWEIARATIERARAAMGVDWHTAEPVLRLLEVAHGASANAAEKNVRDIPIHGGVNNWYIDVENPPARFRVVIGYKSSHGRFYTVCKSNVVQTPEPGACDPIDGHWQDIAEDYERIYSLSDSENGTGGGDLREMFEERLQRPMMDTKGESFQGGADVGFRRERDLPFEVDAELIVYGSTIPGATVTLAGEPVRLSADGTFTVRMELPDRRQVIPVVACSRDGMRQRTTVVAVERNTKVMEAVSRHNME